ncbi:MAG: HAMP domain-containing sensor histidine kinase [Ancalomicrobiaceae bacterium]|nr:HAMP domain-containing sensor histidine kinase [Ancalomicrobiaceae bacterium]
MHRMRRPIGQHHHRFVSPLKRRMFWRFYVTLIVALMAMVLIGGAIWHHFSQERMPPGFENDAQIVEALLPPADAPRDAIETAITRMVDRLDGYVALWGRDGRLIFAAGSPHRMPMFAVKASRSDLDLPPGHSFRAWRVDLADGRVLVARDLRPPSEPPPGFLYLLLIALAIGLAALPFVGRITRRLELLKRAVDDWGAGRLDVRVPETGHDEIAALSRSFNAAAARISELIAAHRTLLAHASHELRSPLARLRMAIEVFGERPTADLKRSIEQDIDELNALVEEILLASRLDHTGVAEREDVDLLALAAEEAARLGALVAEPAPGETFVVPGSGRLLRRMIRNLVENAFKHGAPPVEIALEKLPAATPGTFAQVRLTVRDQGCGLEPGERERVFEPFYRPFGHAETGGSWGLGLALVRRIASGHGGSVACDAAPSGGARFTVDLPLGPKQ